MKKQQVGKLKKENKPQFTKGELVGNYQLKLSECLKIKN